MEKITETALYAAWKQMRRAAAERFKTDKKWREATDEMLIATDYNWEIELAAIREDAAVERYRRGRAAYVKQESGEWPG